MLCLLFYQKYIVVCVIALFMTGVNLYGFFRCQRHARQKLKELTNSMIAGVMQNTVTVRITCGMGWCGLA